MGVIYLIPLFILFLPEAWANDFECDFFWSTDWTNSKLFVSPEIHLRDVYSYSRLLREQRQFNRTLRHEYQGVRDFLMDHDIHALQVLLTSSREMPISERYPYLRSTAPALWRGLLEKISLLDRKLEILQQKLERIHSLLGLKLAALNEIQQHNFRQRSAISLLQRHERSLGRKHQLLKAARLPLRLLHGMVDEVYEHQFRHADERLTLDPTLHDPGFLVWAYLLLFQSHPYRNALREMNRFWPQVLDHEKAVAASWTEKLHPFRYQLSAKYRSQLKLEP